MEEEEKIGEQRRCRAKNKGKKKEGNIRKRDWRRNKKSIGSCKEQNKTIRERRRRKRWEVEAEGGEELRKGGECGARKLSSKFE